MGIAGVYSFQMNEELLSHIEDLGLSEKEARVYLANLMIGPATVQKIADQAEIKRVTTYVILESLGNLGLVSKTNQGKKTYFTAEDPVSLRRLLDKKEQQVKEQKSAFDALLPDLQGLKNMPTDSPIVKFYESPDGINSIFSSFFAAHRGEFKLVYGISNLDHVHKFFPEVAERSANPERVKFGIKSRYIYTSERGQIYKQTDKDALRESRFVDPKRFPLKGDISISNDYVIILALEGAKPIGVLIKSREIADMMVALFELAWEAADRTEKTE